jgi:hypothetical protein
MKNNQNCINIGGVLKLLKREFWSQSTLVDPMVQLLRTIA